MLTITLLALLTSAAPAPIPPVEAVVVEVIDGDTISVTVDGVAEKVRLIGIDAPEMASCGGPEARDHLAALLNAGIFTLTEGGDGEDRDRYDRLLRYVTDGTPGPGFDAGRSMLADGYAIARYDSRDGYGRHWLEDDYIAADEASPALTLPCGDLFVDQQVPTEPQAEPAAALEPEPESAPEPESNGGNVFYQNCGAVRAAGADPITPGDPGWQDKFDRDNDGVGCE
jgi:endonuclease YncB( thermonuclease family)